jgi:hypothetical protein
MLKRHTTSAFQILPDRVSRLIVADMIQSDQVMHILHNQAFEGPEDHLGQEVGIRAGLVAVGGEVLAEGISFDWLIDGRVEKGLADSVCIGG